MLKWDMERNLAFLSFPSVLDLYISFLEAEFSFRAERLVLEEMGHKAPSVQRHNGFLDCRECGQR